MRSSPPDKQKRCPLCCTGQVVLDNMKDLLRTRPADLFLVVCDKLILSQLNIPPYVII